MNIEEIKEAIECSIEDYQKEINYLENEKERKIIEINQKIAVYQGRIMASSCIVDNLLIEQD